MDGVIGDPTYADQGVAAGGPTAPFELALATLPTIVRLRESGLPIVISIHVDDYLMTGTGKGDDEVLDYAVQVAVPGSWESEVECCQKLAPADHLRLPGDQHGPEEVGE